MTNGQTVTISETSYPKEIAEAIFKISTAIGQLGKDTTNPFGKYKYVPIDKYYERVAKVALENNLTWTCKEAESRVQTGDGRDNPIIKFTFMFTLIHRSGICVPACDVISIYHQFQGAQTAGSAASYAEKLFMRKLFKVITGEEDADATDPNVSFDDLDIGDIPIEPPLIEPPAPAVPENKEWIEERDGFKVIKEVPSGTNQWDVVYKFFEEYMPTMKSRDDVTQWWHDNETVLDQAKIKAPKIHQSLSNLFKEKFYSFKENADG